MKILNAILLYKVEIIPCEGVLEFETRFNFIVNTKSKTNGLNLTLHINRKL